MTPRTLVLAGALLAASASAQAQVTPLTFDQAAYVTCREAQTMQPEARKAPGGLSRRACRATSWRRHSRERSRSSARPSGARRLHACARRLSVHCHRPRDHGRAVEAAEAFKKLIDFSCTRRTTWRHGHVVCGKPLIAQETVLVTHKLAVFATLLAAIVAMAGCSFPERGTPVPKAEPPALCRSVSPTRASSPTVTPSP